MCAWRASWNAILCCSLSPPCLLQEARSKLCPWRLLTRSLTLQLHGYHRPHPHPGALAPRQHLGTCFVLLLSRRLDHEPRLTQSPNASEAASVGTGRKRKTAATSGCWLTRPCSCLRAHVHHLPLPCLARCQSCAPCALIRGGLSFSSLPCSFFQCLPCQACGCAPRGRCLKYFFPAPVFKLFCCGNLQEQQLPTTVLRLAATRPSCLQPPPNAGAAAALGLRLPCICHVFPGLLAANTPRLGLGDTIRAQLLSLRPPVGSGRCRSC